MSRLPGEVDRKMETGTFRQFKKAAGRVLAAGFITALAAGVAGCAGSVVYYQDFDATYTGPEASFGAGDALWVEVLGRPGGSAGLDSRKLAALVAQGMAESGPHWLNTTFVARAELAHDPRYRVRVLFGPPSKLTVLGACGKDAAGASSDSGAESDQMIVAFCRDDRFLSGLEGSIQGIGANQPARFRRAMGLAARILMPQVNPDLVPDCDDPLECT